jgi:tetratricopeptide (TPR) repeat protein
MKKSFAAVLLIFTVLLNGYSQKKVTAKDKEAVKELFEDAEFFYESEDYKEALFNYLKINELKPDNGNINFHIGMCYLNIPGEETKAVPYLEQAATKISTTYEKSTLQETRAPLHALYYLGIAYRSNNQMTNSLETFNKFRNHKYFEGHYNENLVDQDIQATERAKIIQDKPVNIKKTVLIEPINNASSNYSAVVTPDETLMVYVSSLKFYNAIFMSRNENGIWTEPVNISPEVGSDGDCEPTGISADGKDLYLVKKVKKTADIYVSHWQNDHWTTMEPLNKNINTSHNEAHASVSADGKTLYFSSDRRGGYGKLDIYKSEQDASGNWGPAVNLGSKVNSDANETTPFITEDGKTLYFSSDGSLNMGGYDIFMSKLRPDKQWDTPINAGYPINTTSNNTFYMPVKNGQIAYYSLILPDGFGKEDICRIENLTISSQNDVSDKGQKKVHRVVVRDRVTNEVLGVLQYDTNVDSVKVQQTNDKILINVDENE